MTVYQCFFFFGGEIDYWENIECLGDIYLPGVLRRRLLNDPWKCAEAWLGEALICRVRRRAADFAFDGAADFEWLMFEYPGN
jgi:hypothetical protein